MDALLSGELPCLVGRLGATVSDLREIATASRGHAAKSTYNCLGVHRTATDRSACSLLVVYPARVQHLPSCTKIQAAHFLCHSNASLAIVSGKILSSFPSRVLLTIFPPHSILSSCCTAFVASPSKMPSANMDKQDRFELTEIGDTDSSPEREHYGYEMKPGTATDDFDMRRLGKTQQLSRNFHALSIFGLTSVVMFTWQAILS